ncbi:hypothetical protein TIFTF001_043470 [Ficus carica]|uniref:Uncharacterized protein n=1 Tax=Ficus carica TaxID=3494 RepID=A0AA88CIK1_FICCA|nr:hypothetical protein TIFTF001_043467 [Ficus carica]GMN22193.1 hypothetical protein TIFTF001_043470 [Ficus carica]
MSSEGLIPRAYFGGENGRLRSRLVDRSTLFSVRRCWCGRSRLNFFFRSSRAFESSSRVLARSRSTRSFSSSSSMNPFARCRASWIVGGYQAQISFLNKDLYLNPFFNASLAVPSSNPEISEIAVLKRLM